MLGLRLASPQGLSVAWKWILAALVVHVTVDQLLFSYMRSGSLWPALSLFLAFALRRRINRRVATAMVAVMVLFILVLEPLSDMRQQSIVGRGRFNRLVSDTRPNPAGFTDGMMHVLARVSTSSQLSQIGRIADEDGLLGGETVSYALFIFIPRAIWPDKPQIAPAQWFAEKIGRGQRLASGKFSNAVNMTVPGELFLNFGWIGTILGLALYQALYGWLISVTWNATMVAYRTIIRSGR